MKSIRVFQGIYVVAIIFFLSGFSWGKGEVEEGLPFAEEIVEDDIIAEEVLVQEEVSAPQWIVDEEAFEKKVIQEVTRASKKVKTPTPPKLHGERLAKAQEEEGKFKEAWATWKGVVQRENDQGTLVRYAQFLKGIGEPDEAIVVVKGILQDYPPRNPSLFYWIADAYAEQGSFREASSQLKTIQTKFPQEVGEVKRRLAHLDRMEAKAKPQIPQPVQVNSR